MEEIFLPCPLIKYPVLSTHYDEIQTDRNALRKQIIRTHMNRKWRTPFQPSIVLVFDTGVTNYKSLKMMYNRLHVH